MLDGIKNQICVRMLSRPLQDQRCNDVNLDAFIHRLKRKGKHDIGQIRKQLDQRTPGLQHSSTPALHDSVSCAEVTSGSYAIMLLQADNRGLAGAVAVAVL